MAGCLLNPRVACWGSKEWRKSAAWWRALALVQDFHKQSARHRRGYSEWGIVEGTRELQRADNAKREDRPERTMPTRHGIMPQPLSWRPSNRSRRRAATGSLPVEPGFLGLHWLAGETCSGRIGFLGALISNVTAGWCADITTSQKQRPPTRLLCLTPWVRTACSTSRAVQGSAYQTHVAGLHALP